MPDYAFPPHARRRWQTIKDMTLGQAKGHLLGLKAELDQTLTKEVFHQLTVQSTYRNMLAEGRVWQHRRQRDIRGLSKANLQALRRALAPLTRKEGVIVEALKGLDYTLTHNTKLDHKGTLFEERKILSKTEIEALGRDQKGGTKNEMGDKDYLHNEDFVFFCLTCGIKPAMSRFGRLCIVFSADRLFEEGWVSLHDMLSPTHSRSMAFFPKIERLREIKRLAFSEPLRVTIPAPHKQSTLIRHTYIESGQVRVFCRTQEVFFGPDIREGIALSVVQELRLMGDGMVDLAYGAQGDQQALANLVFNLFRPEAKIPREFKFGRKDFKMAFKTKEYDAKKFIQ